MNIMANKKISELNQATELQDTDLMAVVQENQGNADQPLETRKTTIGALRSSITPTIQSNDGSLVVSTQGNTVDIRMTGNPITGGGSENFPLSMAEGGQSLAVGFYGVRFTPLQNYIAKYAQICKRDNMTSGTFVVAIYSAGTTPTGGRTENMQLLAQTEQTSMAGNGLGTAVFSENQQVELEAGSEYYMVVYVQHPSNSSRGLICKRTNGNEWGNSNLSLAFYGNSQTVLPTLGSSNFTTLFPSTGVNAITLPYMKIFGDSVISNNAGQIPSSQVLVINDDNASSYLQQSSQSIATTVDLLLPMACSTIIVDTTQNYTISKIRPAENEFSNYKKIAIMGSVTIMDGESCEHNRGDYRISRYWYNHRQQERSFLSEAFAEFILRNKVWYSVFY